MAGRTPVDDSEEGRRHEAIPPLEAQPWRLSLAQIELGLTSAEHGPALLARLFSAGALAADRDGVLHYLAENGISFMSHMVDSGQLFPRFALLTRGGTLGPGLPAGTGPGDRMELAEEATIGCLSTFLAKLARGAWRPDEGASVYTYFTNGCVLAAKGPYRRLLARMREVPFGDRQYIAGETDPVRHIDELADIERFRNRLSERDRTVFEGLWNGDRIKDIAKRLGLSSESVRRTRQRLRDHLRKGEGND